MSVGTWILLGVVVIAALTIIFRGRKKKWYDVYLANNDVIRVYRKMADWWLRDSEGIMSFRLADGRSLRLAKHWILKVEEVQEEVK